MPTSELLIVMASRGLDRDFTSRVLGVGDDHSVGMIRLWSIYNGRKGRDTSIPYGKAGGRFPSAV